MNIQKRLKALRLQKGWTQKELAVKMNLTEKAISNYENGHRQIDSEKLEQFGKLFGMDWMEADKKASKTVTVSAKEMAKNGFIMSASHYVNKQSVTLRVDISQGVKKQLEQMAKKEGISLDEMAEKALLGFMTHIKVGEKTPIYSEYYEKEFLLTDKEASVLYNLYARCCEKLREKPDFANKEAMMVNAERLTTALYHVETYCQEEKDYAFITHLFEN